MILFDLSYLESVRTYDCIISESLIDCHIDQLSGIPIHNLYCYEKVVDSVYTY